MKALPLDEALPLFSKVIGSEDQHGHRYMAQLEDGPNGVRWLLPMPRSEWEQVYAAILSAHPEYAEQLGSPVNMVRQWVGQMMYYVLQLARDDEQLELPPTVQARVLKQQIEQRREALHVHRETVQIMCDPRCLPNERQKAYQILSGLQDEELEEIMSPVPDGMTGREMLQEKYHEHA